MSALANPMTPEERAVARHALGLPNDRRVSYRNHFVAEEGTADFDLWRTMVERGLARQHRGSVLTGGAPLFMLTRAGGDRAIDQGEGLGDRHFPFIQQD